MAVSAESLSLPMFSPMEWFDPLLAQWQQGPLASWAAQLQPLLSAKLVQQPHGDWARWQQAWQSLPQVAAQVDASQDTLLVHADQPLTPAQQQQAREALWGLRPWRKGPFQILDTFIDTEWRSDWKWQRVAPHIADLTGRKVLDVGCGSGYHCWRMWGAGAAEVIGIDPSLLFLLQFQAVKHYAPTAPVHLLPVRMEDVPPQLEYFDTTFSMGVLYHRRDPLEHIQQLLGTLVPGGELVLETLVVEGDENTLLMPEDRYAMMRNVWFLPSVPMLLRWLRRLGVADARVVDVTATRCEEQRSTEWMPFQSLADFLDPEDASKTIEGYPAPLRATFCIRKR